MWSDPGRRNCNQLHDEALDLEANFCLKGHQNGHQKNKPLLFAGVYRHNRGERGT